MDGMGSLKHSHTRAPLCGAKNNDNDRVPAQKDSRRRYFIDNYNYNRASNNEAKTSKTTKMSKFTRVKIMFSNRCFCFTFNIII